MPCMSSMAGWRATGFRRRPTASSPTRRRSPPCSPIADSLAWIKLARRSIRRYWRSTPVCLIRWKFTMHEMSLAEGVLQIVEETARRENASRVKLVVLEIGRMSSVQPEALRFCFDAVTRGSIADGTTLDIVDVPGSGWCLQCMATVPMQELYGACPTCGSHQVQPTGGTEMRVKEIEIE